MKRTFILYIFCAIALSALSQVEIRYFPKGDALSDVSIARTVNIKKATKVAKSYKMPSFDKAKMLKEDKEMEEVDDVPFRFGKSFDVGYTLKDGTWYNVDGGRLWKMTVESDSALTLNFVFEDFHLPEGANLYIVNDDQTVVYGPVEPSHIPENGFFLTDIISGSKATISLFEPTESKGLSTLTVKRVVHGYRGAYVNMKNGLVGSSSTCNSDIACFPAFNNESKAIALVLLANGNELCSGSLVMTTDLSFRPYFLTAFHCINDDYNTSLSSSEISDAEKWMFKFNYKKTTCEGSSVTTGITFNGATFRAAYYNTDFALMEMKGGQANSNLRWLGWDRSGIAPTEGACIHHPMGDVMKISITSNPLTTASGDITHWRVDFDGGVVENGSSGSPFLDENKRVVGQLTGPKTVYEDPCLNRIMYYGKFSSSWNGGGTSSTRLKDWLDPVNSQQLTIDGHAPFAPTLIGDNIICDSSVYTVTNLPTGYSVNWYLNNPYYITKSNYPSTNQCMIKRNPYHSMDEGTLTAYIRYNGQTVKTLTKKVYVHNDFYAKLTDVYRNLVQDSIPASYPIFVPSGQHMRIKSANFGGMNVRYVAGNYGSAEAFYFDKPDEVSFTLKAGQDITIYAEGDNSCDDFKFFIFATTSSNTMSVAPLGDNLYVSIGEETKLEQRATVAAIDDENDMVWTMEVYNAETGRRMHTETVVGKTAKVNLSGWPKGIYAVRAMVGKEVFSEKFNVK